MGVKLEESKGRVTFFDTIRGLSVVSMILFHFTYDLFFISHIKLTWFTPLLMQVWIPSISYPFIFIAGCMCAFSKNSFKRAGVYSLVALIDDSATVKTFYRENDRIRLQPENDFMEPIYVQNPVILGRVTALIRSIS